jgi:hypothetical protein
MIFEKAAMQQLEITTRELLCGGTAGISGIFIGHPLDLIKIRLQTQPGKYLSALDCFSKTVRNEGILVSICIIFISIFNLLRKLIALILRLLLLPVPIQRYECTDFRTIFPERLDVCGRIDGANRFRSQLAA